jgi:hypothetical protein
MQCHPCQSCKNNLERHDRMTPTCSRLTLTQKARQSHTRETHSWGYGHHQLVNKKGNFSALNKNSSISIIYGRHEHLNGANFNWWAYSIAVSMRSDYKSQLLSGWALRFYAPFPFCSFCGWKGKDFIGVSYFSPEVL